jgi:hypothetical protein
MLTLQALLIALGKSYHQTVDLLNEISGILDKLASRGFLTLPYCVTGSRSSRW